MAVLGELSRRTYDSLPVESLPLAEIGDGLNRYNLLLETLSMLRSRLHVEIRRDLLNFLLLFPFFIEAITFF